MPDALALTTRQLVRVTRPRARARAPPARAPRPPARPISRHAPGDAAAAPRRSPAPSCADRATSTDPGTRSAPGVAAARSARRRSAARRRRRRDGSLPPSARADAGRAGPRVDFPLPDSPTSPSVSPAATGERHVVDRAHRPPPRAGNCFTSPSTSSSALIGVGAPPTPSSAKMTRGAVVGAEERISGGTACRTAPRRARQRGMERAPRREPRGIGRRARDREQRRRAAVDRGTDASSPRVYGCPARANRPSRGPSSTTRPAYITTTRSATPGDHAEVVADITTARPISRLQLRRAARGSAPGSSRRARSSARRRSAPADRLASAIANITRCRIPPDSSCGIRARSARRRGHTDPLEHLHDARPSRGVTTTAAVRR